MSWFGLSQQENRYWEQFMVGDRVDIVLEKGVIEVFLSKIKGISSRRLALTPPVLGSSVLEIAQKSKIGINVYKQAGIFTFKTRVITQGWEQNDYIEVTKPGRISLIQRREFYRLNILIPVEYGIMPAEDFNLETPPLATFSGITKNISEGGVLMVIDKTMPINTALKLRINLDANFWIPAVGRVIEQKSMDVENKFSTQVQFFQISENDKEEIHKFVIIRSHQERR